MLTVPLFAIAKNWKQPNCQWTDNLLRGLLSSNKTEHTTTAHNNTDESQKHSAEQNSEHKSECIL